MREADVVCEASISNNTLQLGDQHLDSKSGQALFSSTNVKPKLSLALQLLSKVLTSDST